MRGDPYLAKSYVIDASDKLPWPMRLRDLVLTLVVWYAYCYFMKDSVPFVHDAAIWVAHGFDDFSKYPGLKTLPDIVSFIRLGGCFSALLIAWSYYNIVRYGKKKRRRSIAPIEIERLAHDYEVDTSEVRAWQDTRILTMYHDKLGRLYKVVEE